ncbi:MAG: deoxyribose-phosphate aldolase [Spirochaetales bacterium]
MTAKELAPYFDHTLLKATAREADIVQLCREARESHFATVCIQPVWVPRCADELRGSGVGVCTVIGFPLGANTTAVKVAETKLAVEQGATEVDMVINVGWALDERWADVTEEIRQIRVAAGKTPLKVILETCYLTDEAIGKACDASAKAGAAFVKTSTGFGTGGATESHIRLMRSRVPASMKVKASGGIRTLADAVTMIEAGASRLGASASVAILKELKGEADAGVSSGY